MGAVAFGAARADPRLGRTSQPLESQSQLVGGRFGVGPASPVALDIQSANPRLFEPEPVSCRGVSLRGSHSGAAWDASAASGGCGA